jgi:SulP family sulfate permease
MTPGSVIGELGVFLDEPRTASVVADEACVLHCLRKDSMERMAKEQPDLSRAFQMFTIRTLSERLVRANRAVHALLE